MTTRPNILWISTHDISPHLGAYAGVWPGAEQAVTPHLDALADEGARFDAAFAAAPVCAPSRAAIMTGCYPTAIGTIHMRTKAVPPPEVKLFPEYLRAAGYYTTNNWFTDFQMETPPTAFDDCSETGHWRNRPTPETPFFAAFHGMVTHESQIYLDDDAFLAATSHVSDEQRHRPEDVELPPYYPDTEVFRKSWARYLDLITEMDAWVGGLLAELEGDGLRDDTIVVFWSDHGLGMPRAKRWAHEAGLREPLLVRWPERIAPGSVRTEIVQLMDLAPTMLAALDLPVPEHMHGAPLFGSDGGFRSPNIYAFGARERMDEQEDSVRTVRDARYRYIRNLHPDRSELQHNEYADHLDTWKEFRRLAFEEAGQLARGERPNRLTDLQRAIVAPAKPAEELYDIESDPHETVNLAGDPALAGKLGELRAALDEWTEHYGDLGLLPERELIETWRPGGRTAETAAPELLLEDGRVAATCATEGASLAWTTDPPREAAGGPPSWTAALGLPDTGGRRWRLYTGPFEPPVGERVWMGAWRMGFTASEVVEAPLLPSR
ncbi:sulfatase-like hydrolase/transferase [Naasia sp. SYSU D00057]|uniref:sulfatase-like hydrolase/transferase n=1 Tax=Naasia sp. SYSU D00057 TaxID=2817380 RepID=UPI001B30E17F|nr:sulfatase-like hydrolase/transferase [Naasia sp. SYSU D00057]